MSNVMLSCTFDYEHDTVFNVSSQAAARQVPVYDPKDIHPYGKNDATQSFRNLFRLWGKGVDGVNTKLSGGYCFTGRNWLKNQVTIAVAKPPMTVMGYASVQNYHVLNNVTTMFPVETMLSSAVSLVTLNLFSGVRFAAIVARQEVAQKVLDYNEFGYMMANVSLPFPWNTIDGNDPLAHSMANAKFIIRVPHDMRILAVGLDDKTANRMLAYDSASMNIVETHENELYRRLALCVETLLDNKDLVLSLNPNETYGSQPAQVFAMLVGRREASPVLAEPTIPKYSPPSLFSLPGFGDLPSPPKGYCWIASQEGLLYLCALDGSRVMMPYDVLDLLALMMEMNSPESGSRGYMAKYIHDLQRLYDNQIQLLQGMFHNYRIFRGRDVQVPPEDDLDI